MPAFAPPVVSLLEQHRDICVEAVTLGQLLLQGIEHAGVPLVTHGYDLCKRL